MEVFEASGIQKRKKAKKQNKIYCSQIIIFNLPLTRTGYSTSSQIVTHLKKTISMLNEKLDIPYL